MAYEEGLLDGKDRFCLSGLDRVVQIMSTVAHAQELMWRLW